MNARSGLSLFELLVALALLALITAGLAGALGMAVRVWDRAAGLYALSEEIALRGRLRSWLEQATPPTRLTPFPAGLTGSADGLSFVTLAETPFAPDAAALRVTVSREGDRLTLLAETLDDEGTTLSRIEGPLARGIAPRFAYYDDMAQPPAWRDSWENTDTLPALVRITAEEGSTPDWPDFVVRPVLR